MSTPTNIPFGRTALLVVDAQPTFMPGGELPVPGGENIIAPLLAFIRDFGAELGLIVFSRDWHPRNHFSFDDENPRYSDGSWPTHGVAGTDNAGVHPALTALCQELGLPYIIISKGMEQNVEAYSAFDGFNLDNINDGIPLEEELYDHDIESLIVAGLAGEVCVKATALAGLKIGYAVSLLTNAIGFLGDPAPAYAELLDAGAVCDALPSK